MWTVVVSLVLVISNSLSWGPTALVESKADSGKGKEKQGQFSQEQKALQMRKAFVTFVMHNWTKPT